MATLLASQPTSQADCHPQSSVMIRAVKPLEREIWAPYASEGWGWKVGKRVGKDECYVDQYRFPPGSQMLSSSKDVKAFLAERHPDWEHEDFIKLYKTKILAETSGTETLSAGSLPAALPGPVSMYPPVAAGAKGDGGPYAPDGWGWGVGQRVKSDGTYADRYLWPPGASATGYIASNAALERWLKENGVACDIGDFWGVYKKWIPAVLSQGDSKAADQAETSAAGAAASAISSTPPAPPSPGPPFMRSSRGRPLQSSRGESYDYDSASPSPKKPPSKRARSTVPARSTTSISIKDILLKWRPPVGRPYFPAIVPPNRNWHEHLPADSEGALFIGQCVFLRSSESGELPPYVVRVTEILVDHPEGKVAANYAFYRQSDLQQIAGCESLESEDALGEVRVSFERMEFSADEIEGPTTADPYFWADKDDMYYKRFFDRETVTIHPIDFNLIGTPERPNYLPDFLDALQGDLFRSNSRASGALDAWFDKFSSRLINYVTGKFSKTVADDAWVPVVRVSSSIEIVALFPSTVLQ